MAKFTLNVCVTRDVLDALDKKSAATGVSRSAWAQKILRDSLLGPSSETLRANSGGPAAQRLEATKQSEISATISNRLDRSLIELMEARPELIKSLDDKTLAQLMVARVPKPKDSEVEIEQSYLSLSESLNRLPELEDLTKELARAKAQVMGLMAEAECMRGTLDLSMSRRCREEGMDWPAMRRMLNEWQKKVLEVARRYGDVLGVEIPDFKALVVTARRDPSAAPAAAEPPPEPAPQDKGWME